MAASGKVLGTVTSVVGEAKATAADGTVRILQVGDVVHSDETITTSAAGAVNIALENGKMLDCGANSDLSLHESILGVATAASNVPGAPGAAAPGSVEALQQAIASGQDPSQIAPATAAGGAPAAGGAGGDGGGGTPVVIEQANSAGPITAGFGTAGAGIAFPTPEFQLLPPTEQEPAVSVSVQVQVQVQVQVDVAVSVEAGVEVLNGPAQGGVFAISASGDAVSLLEGSLPGTNVVPFVITLSQVFDTDVQVTYQIVSGTAQTPSDYFGVLTATITIPAGETSFTVPIDIVRDQVVEGNETFSIVLVNATNATINPDHDTAMVTIFNDDAPPVANNDTNWTQEDTHVLASGNVLQNQPHAGAPSGSFADAADTDNFETPTVTNPGTYAGAHGTLVLAADGTYTYTLNNSSAAVQGLDSGETLIETFGYTITDGFNAPDSATLTVTIFGSNDVPEITVKTSGEIFASGAVGTVDEAALANGSNPSSNAEFVTGSFKVADTDGVDDLQSVTINGQTVAMGNLVGAVFHGSAGDMTVTSFSGGVANFTYELKHAVTDVANQAETDVFTLTTSDGTSNSAPANVTITIIDDVPSANVAASQATGSLTVDETDLATNATTNFAADFSGGSSFGADGPGSVSDAIYTLSVNAGPTGLIDTATNQDVVLVMNGAVVEGQVSAGEGGHFVVFTVSVDGSGNVTLDQQRAVVHTPDSGPDQSTSLASANLIVLTRSATITDADGDTANASASINLGQALHFEDDAPSVNVSVTQAADTLTVDESDLEANASANFADNFGISSSFGADGPGTLSVADFSLSINAGTTGLVDTATNQAVTLVMNGGSVEGRVSNGEGGFFVVFTVSVDAGGTVTLDQQRAVVHSPDTGPDQSTSMSTADLVVLTRTATITDKDGDAATSSASINIGTALHFEDDAPSINVSLADVSTDGLTVDETVLGTDATANFADNFDSSSDFGADGAGSASSAYALSVGGGSTGLVDTATNQAVTLAMNGGVVEGRVSNGEGGFFVVFTVSADASGTVTLDQQRAVMHTPNTGPDQSTSLASADLVVLTRTDTITDKDGDSASSSQSIQIGTSLHFEDDAPSIDITGGDTSVIEGQSITNGTWTSASGADAPATTKVVIGETEYNLNSAIDTGKGTLTVNSNGTWTFAAAGNQSNPQVVSFSVKITDKDLDSASDSHTITINDGANPAASAPQSVTVNEAALSDGSNPSSTAETAAAALTFTSGSDAITSIVFGATGGISVSGLDNLQPAIAWAVSNGGHTLTGSISGTPVIQVVLSGDLSVAAGGSVGNVTATATLLDNMLHQDSPNAGSLTITGVQVVGQDTDGDTATFTFTGITVIDDAPSISATNVAVPNVEATYTGTYTFTVGADGQPFANSFAPSALSWTDIRDGYAFALDSSTASSRTYKATFNGGADTFFTITVKADGTYDFNLVTADPVTTVTVDSILAGLAGGSNLSHYLIDSTHFGGQFGLDLTGYGGGGATTDGIWISSTDLGVGDDVMHGNSGDLVRFDVQPVAGSDSTIASITIHESGTGGAKATDQVDMFVKYVEDPGETSSTQAWGNDHQVTFAFDTTKTVDYIEITPHDDKVMFKIDAVGLSYTVKQFPDDFNLNFSLTGTDKDVDSASTNFTVAVNTTDTSTYQIDGTNGNDNVYGTTGDDSMTGAGGHDVFVFNSMADAADTVTDFHIGNTASDANADVLDIGDILPGTTEGATLASQLSGYVTLDTVSSPGNTIVKVDANGGGDGFQTLVTLNGVTGVTLQQMLDNHQIVT